MKHITIETDGNQDGVVRYDFGDAYVVVGAAADFKLLDYLHEFENCRLYLIKTDNGVSVQADRSLYSDDFNVDKFNWSEILIIGSDNDWPIGVYAHLDWRLCEMIGGKQLFDKFAFSNERLVSVGDKITANNVMTKLYDLIVDWAELDASLIERWDEIELSDSDDKLVDFNFNVFDFNENKDEDVDEIDDENLKVVLSDGRKFKATQYRPLVLDVAKYLLDNYWTVMSDKIENRRPTYSEPLGKLANVSPSGKSLSTKLTHGIYVYTAVSADNYLKEIMRIASVAGLEVTYPIVTHKYTVMLSNESIFEGDYYRELLRKIGDYLALHYPGRIRAYTVKDVPGLNHPFGTESLYVKTGNPNTSYELMPGVYLFLDVGRDNFESYVNLLLNYFDLSLAAFEENN